MSPETRILVAIPCLLRGGTEQQTLQLARVIHGWGSHVTICCYFESDESVVAEFEDCGATVQRLGLVRGISSWGILRALRSAFLAQKPTLVHVQYMAPGFLAVSAARLAGVPKVLATVHQPATPYGLKARWLLRSAAHMCDQFICVSEAVERSWFGSSRLHAHETGTNRSRSHHCSIHNAVDLAQVDAIIQRTNRAELRQQLGFGQEWVIGVVSRLTKEKGIDILLDAMPLILRQVPNTSLLIVGDGAERPTLEAQARSNGLSQASLSCGAERPRGSSGNRSASKYSDAPVSRDSFTPPSAAVIWAGRQPWKKCIEFMQAMDLVIVPSRFEGFGLSAAEAMACGKPVIAANVDGLREMIDHDRSGVLFKAQNPEDLAGKVLALLQDARAQAEIGSTARHRAESLFSMEVFRSNSLDLYSHILKAPARM